VNDEAAGGAPLPENIDTTVPHSARIWNYWLGGEDHYPVDREAGEAFRKIYPDIVELARAVRSFLGRAVRYLAGEAGIRQFLDVGAGLPTVDNTHELAQRVAPESRIVYVDHDPLILAHSRALLTSRPEGVCAYVDADVRRPEAVLDAAAATLDFGRPVALIMLGILGLVEDYDEARSIVRQLTGALPPGSYLTLSDGADISEARQRAHRYYAETGAIPYRLRSLEQIAGFFDGLDLLEPGVVPVSRWRPDPSPSGLPGEVSTFGGVARKR
jgi:O-methyltransferase involved in polyketide biosynthesis